MKTVLSVVIAAAGGRPLDLGLAVSDALVALSSHRDEC